MFEIILALIIWTWGLTPLWVNIVVSTLLFIRGTYSLSKLVGEVCSLGEKKEEEIRGKQLNKND